MDSEHTKTCFVISPIGNAGSEIRKNADQLLEHIIKPACEDHNIDVTRSDLIFDNSRIDQKIIEQLDNADLVIADLTKHNPNVFYELGYRYATGKPIIHMIEINDNIPFDVATIRTISYDLHDLDIAKRAKKQLSETIKGINFSEQPVSKRKPPVDYDTNIPLPLLFNIQNALFTVLDRQKNLENNLERISSTVNALKRSRSYPSPRSSFFGSPTVDNDSRKPIITYSEDDE